MRRTHSLHVTVPQILAFLMLLLAVSGSPMPKSSSFLYPSNGTSESTTVARRFDPDDNDIQRLDQVQTRDVVTSADNYLSQSAWGPSLAATALDPMLYPHTSGDPETSKTRAGELLQEIGKQLAPLMEKDYWKRDFGGALKKSLSVVGGLIPLMFEAGVKTIKG
ncbi:hypothetical protein K435DRAFT_840393 [Dendrothele bispora CBS 962.96]|uniref:Uncharacterized protein n=1 Tax=Dendrothele bispora (strain CBS 962.96) TaxID=1314807 RepID=A0A4S8LV84_DENBC|nr:hypothetical protein K435DRAFT_840393 [Dendrothele bispora CBS 962.96]